MNILPSGTSEIISESGQTIGNIISQTVTSSTNTNLTIAYNILTLSSYSIFIQTSTVSYLTLSENSSIVLSPDVTCSLDNTTYITYSLQSYNSVPVPDWVSINSTSSKLYLSTPSVTSQLDVSFYIQSSSSLTSTQLNLINLRINKCSLPN